MVRLGIILGLFILQVASIALLRAYKDVKPVELKRRASRGDEVAAMLYRVAAYGRAVSWVLWLLVSLSSSGLFLVLNRTFNGLLAYLLVAASIWLSLVWLPAQKVVRPTRALAVLLSPLLARLLSILHPVSRRISKLVRRPLHVHTGVYQKEDLIELLQHQKQQKDNRINPGELEIIEHSLSFGDKIIRDYMTPRSVVEMVQVDEPISTHLLDRLHRLGHSRYPAYEVDQDDIKGIVYLRDLMGAKESGTVRTVMRDQVYFVHEEKPLMHALQAFLSTENHLFIVVNNFEEMVGIVTIEDVLEQVIGQQIVDEFDQYDSMRAVAELMADKEQAAHKHIDEEISL